MYFVARGRRRPYALPPGAPASVRIERKFLADTLVLTWPGEGDQARFLFDRGSRAVAALVAEKLSSKLSARA
jgi:hypothetical protein